METAIDLKYAMQVANGETWPEKPMDEARVLRTLFLEHFKARSVDKLEGFTQYQIRDAMGDILRAQDHSPHFKDTVARIGDKLAGHGAVNAGQSDLMGRMVHWPYLSKGQRLEACTQFIDYMAGLFKHEFGIQDSFRLTPRLISVSPWTENDNTGEMLFEPVKAHVRQDPRDNQHYFIDINTLPSGGYDNPFTTMRDIFAAGIKGFEAHLGRQYCESQGLKTPVKFFDDAERMAGFQMYRVFEFAATFEKNTLFVERLPNEQADRMAERLKTFVKENGEGAPVPAPDPNLLQRVAHRLGLH